MDNFFRLSAFALIAVCALLAPADALADDEYFPTRQAASAACQADLAAAKALGSGGGYPQYHAAANNDYACITYGISPDGQTGRYLCRVGVKTSPTAGTVYGCSMTGGAQQTEYYWLADIPCDGLNDDPETAPGSRLCVAEACVPSCKGGCELDIVGNPLETVPGRVQGQPVVYYRFDQTYTGETCTPGEPAEDDFSEQDEGKQCVPSLGICVTEDGENEYCTFNPDGTPSACVPAVDYDNDGTPDEEDTQPGDPENGADDGEGDEGDNAASGGGTCGAAPACSGDGIACAILYQTWATRCAVVNLDLDGGAPGGEEGGGVDTAGMGDANDFGDAGVSAADAWRPGVGEEGGPSGVTDFDTTGWLGGSRSCPVFPVVDVLGVSIDFNFEDLCWFMGIGAQLVLVFAALSSIKIVSRVI